MEINKQFTCDLIRKFSIDNSARACVCVLFLSAQLKN